MATETKEPNFAGLTFDELKDIAAAGMPLDQAKELAKAGFSAEQLLELAGTLPKGQGGLSRADLEAIVKAGSDGKYKQNVQHPGISAYSYPEGDVKRPKPVLKRVTFNNGHREDPEQLTPAEIDAYNSVSRSCSARNEAWKAVVRKNGSTEELHILLPTGLNDRPNESIPQICRELMAGPEAVTQASLAARVAELEAKLTSA